MTRSRNGDDRLRAGRYGAPSIARRRDRGDPNARRHAERRGRWAEAYVAMRLMLHGWRVLARRARTPRGEIDIVMRRGDVLAFVEVKQRADWQAAEAAITASQKQRLVGAAEAWLAGQLARRPELAHHQHRFDAALVKGWRMRHLPDAWRSSDRY